MFVTFVATRVPIIIIAELAAIIIGQRAGVHFAASANPLLAVWGRWDAEHYIDIATTGYSGTEPAFFPLYPLLIRIVGGATGNTSIAGLRSPTSPASSRLLYLYKLVEHEYNRAGRAPRHLLRLDLSDRDLLLGGVHRVAVLVADRRLVLLHARAQLAGLPGLFGFFAAMTRVEGVLLAVPFVIEWLRWRSRAAPRLAEAGRSTPSSSRSPACALIPLGLGVYMAYLWVLRGDPLYFSHVQVHWNRHFAPPWVSVVQRVREIAHGSSRRRRSRTSRSSSRSPL